MEHYIGLTIAAAAREGEQQLWESMRDASIPVSATGVLSAWRDLFDATVRTAASIRSRLRLAENASIRAAIPSWVGDMLSVDLVRQSPGDGTVIPTARETFRSWLATAGIFVTWTLEGGVTSPQIFGTGGATLDAWPDSIEVLLWPEGVFLYLDGGTLDLGIVRDATLNVTNDLQIFAEVFESVAFLGPEAFCLTLDAVCPSGITSGVSEVALDCVAS